MLRAITVVAIIVGSYASSLNAANLTGIYLETRTCQVYTGPCFANAESEGLAGRNAIMAWRFEQGKQGDVDLSGLSVVVVVTATDTLGFRGLDDARSMKTVLLLDEKASEKQRNALIEFVSETVPKATECVVRTDVKPIEMNLDLVKLEGRLKAGKEVVLNTRKAGREDCICMNETAYYPPLAKVEHFAPGVTVDGKFNGRGLGTRWSTPGDRSSYMATFSYE